MKKLLTILLALLMIFTLAGCKSNNKKEELSNDPTVVQPLGENVEVQEQKPVKPINDGPILGGNSEVLEEQPVQPINDGPIFGGFTEAQDKTITKELEDIFNKALEGYVGMSLEPIELYGTQVVAGINYKFVCSGTKTTNPPIKGTYYVTVYKDLENKCSIIDVETITEG